MEVKKLSVNISAIVWINFWISQNGIKIVDVGCH